MFRTGCLVLNPGKCGNGQCPKHGWYPSELDHELGQEAGEGRIANGDGIVESIVTEPHASPGCPDRSIGAKESAGRKSMDVPNGVGGGASRRRPHSRGEDSPTHRDGRFERCATVMILR